MTRLARLVFLMLAFVWITFGQDIAIELQVPDSVKIGSEIAISASVRVARPIEHAYIKISLPSSFQVIEGKPWHEGLLAPGTFSLNLRVRITGPAESRLMARIIIFGNGQEVLGGRADIRQVSAESNQLLISHLDTFVSSGETSTKSAHQNAGKILATSAQGYRLAIRGGSRLLPANRTLSGDIKGGQPTFFKIDGKAGHRIWLTARSAGIDTKLQLFSAAGDLVAEDDDGLGSLDSRLPASGVLELSESGVYTAVVSSHTGADGRFSLTFDDFTDRDSSPRGSAEPDLFAKNPRRAAVPLSGRIVYNTPDGSIAPVRYADVRLYSQGLFFDTLIGESRTDLNGYVSLSVPDGNRNDALYLVVSTSDVGLGIVTVRDAFSGTYYARKATFVLPQSSNVTFNTWNVALDGSNEAFTIFDAAVEGYLICRDVLQYQPPPLIINYLTSLLSIILNPDDPSEVDAYYNPSNGQIYLAALYGTSPDVVLHEYGHFIARNGGFNQIQGGDHKLPFSHVYPSLAWGEGWASFFAVGGQNSHGKPSKQRMVSLNPNNYYDYSLENGHPAGIYIESAAGDDNEGSVQFILWDLFDPDMDALPAGGGSDSVTLGLKPIFDAARNGTIRIIAGTLQATSVNFLEQFYDGLIQQSSFTSDQIEGIRRIFADQHISWEIPPTQPLGIQFVTDSLGISLKWQASSANTSLYVVEQRLPGQSAFAILGTTTATSFRLSNPIVGTTYRVTAESLNVARFTAPFFSSASTALTLNSPTGGGGNSNGQLFVQVTPCRIADTRNPSSAFGGPSIPGNTSRSFAVPASPCGIPTNAQAYSLNVTVVPQGSLSYLTIWPTGQNQPFVSTLNSFDGRVKANAAIVPAGTNGAVNVFVTNTADVILDINGYFVSASNAPSNALQFFPLAPCRISDTRNAAGPLGGPSLAAGVARAIPVSSTCNVPAGAQAYSLNFTAVPKGPLGYISTWPAGQNLPLVSTLNAFTGAITANAAIVPAGTGGSINVFASNPADLIIDINGYFAAPSANGLSFYSVTPCRVSDTRNLIGTFGGPSMAGGQTRNVPVVSSACGLPASAKAYALNATVVPPGQLQYLTLWPTGGAQPFVSTLNSFDASIVSNAAVVPSSPDGSISAFATNLTDLILDVSGYFAP